MPSPSVSKATMTFLRKLGKNNNRPWFTDNKADFKTAEAEIKDLLIFIEKIMGKHDVLEGHKLWRIYRDVRFSKDKTPYKTNFAANFKRAGAARRGGYFLNIQPGSSMAGGGFYGPEKEDLLRVRKEFEADSSEIRKILSAKAFKQTFPEGLLGEELKKVDKIFKTMRPYFDYMSDVLTTDLNGRSLL